MTCQEMRTISVLLTPEHLQKMVEFHLLAEGETTDAMKIARVVRMLLDGALGLPEKPWHDWDEWAKGLT